MRIQRFHNDTGLLPIGEIGADRKKYRFSTGKKLWMEVVGFRLARIAFGYFSRRSTTGWHSVNTRSVRGKHNRVV